MPRCDNCDTTILFGGKHLGELRYCSDDCYRDGVDFAKLSAAIPSDVVAENLKIVHEGKCPKCRGDGPVDVHVWHYVLSVIVVTTWDRKTEVCCQSCGKKANIKGIIFSFLFGWWGFPFGIFVTPMQIIRNLICISNSTDSSCPSPELMQLVTRNLAISESRPEQEDRSSSNAS